MTEPLVKRIDTVFLPVRSLDSSVEWFMHHLGVSLRWKHGAYAALNLGETPLTLVETPDATPLGQVLINFYAPDIAAAHARLAGAGVQVSPLHKEEDHLIHFEFKDLDGNALEMCWYPQ